MSEPETVDSTRQAPQRVQLVDRADLRFEQCLRQVFGGRTRRSVDVERSIAQLDDIAKAQHLRADLLVGAFDEDRVVSAALAVESPGATGLLYIPPATRSPHERQAFIRVLEELKRLAWQRRLRLLQALISADDKPRAKDLAAAGFRFLADLLYMDRAADLPKPRLKQRPEVSWVTYAPERRAAFIQALDATYIDSLDCPGLSDLRDTADVLAGHEATGVFNPNHWFLAMAGDVPAGVLLTAAVHNRSILEVVYMGVSAHFRGIGIGHCLLEKAVATSRREGLDGLTLAVDSINEPARGLYERWGFITTSRRAAWIAAPDE